MASDGNYSTGDPTANAPGSFPDFIKYFADVNPNTEQALGTYPVGVVEPDQSVSLQATHAASFDLQTGASADFSASVGPRGTQVGLDIQAEDGNHVVKLNRGPSTFQATTGNDTVVSGGGTDTMTAGSGHDYFVGGGRSDLIGGSGPDTLVGGLFDTSADTISAGTGGTKIHVTHGSNTIFGNTNDTITAGFAQSSHDTVVGGSGPETIYGGRNTEIFGGGHDSIVAGINNQVNLYGSDTLVGGSHDNTVFTANGSHSLIEGGSGQLDVTLASGKHGNDSIFGGSGEITVHLDKSTSDVLSDHTTNAGVTNITFTGGQQIHISGNVHLDYLKGGGSSS